MKNKQIQLVVWIIAVMMSIPVVSRAQSGVWTLDSCIHQALKANVSVQKARLSVSKNEQYTAQSKAERLPSVSASASQNFSWNKQLDSSTGEYGDYSRNSSSSYGVNAGVTLFNGFKTTNSIRQSQLELESSLFDAKTIEESVELSVLSAYVQMLYARENVINATNQVEATQKELLLSEERLKLGGVSRSDYLQIKSSLATEKKTLADANGTLAMAKITLLQLMEMPVDVEFDVEAPSVESLAASTISPDSQEVFALALQQKPQVKSAELQTENARLNIKMAQADRLPTLSMSAGINSGYAYPTGGFNFADQISNKLTPSVGLTLSIPIFQNRQVKTSINVAKISLSEAELTAIDTRNSLRKEIEQACLDLTTAKIKYQAGLESYAASEESHQVAAEKLQLGLMNSVDYLFEKNNMITAQSTLLQSKYNLIFNTKILDYYKGIPLTL